VRWLANSEEMLTADTDVCELLTTLRRSNVDMLGESLDMTAKRRTLWVRTCPSPTDNSTLPQQPPSSLPAVPPPSPPLSHQKCSQLLALRRTLKVTVVCAFVLPCVQSFLPRSTACAVVIIRNVHCPWSFRLSVCHIVSVSKTA